TAPEGYALIGCEALIRDFKQQDNGLLGIRVEGGRRFRVRDAVPGPQGHWTGYGRHEFSTRAPASGSGIRR
ncbi:hypothetical protein, partial [Klebsiella pneumoniae]|uniref:hypothetical protein n=1 Tax=Klebsiella pneumoniae TaxID=573 RepID=UPI002762B70C|nr:hypothetical protein [Klebsiella pneumoniae]